MKTLHKYVKVRVGSSRPHEGGQLMDVVGAVRHPKFEEEPVPHADVALLKLADNLGKFLIDINQILLHLIFCRYSISSYELYVKCVTYNRASNRESRAVSGILAITSCLVCIY